jgi:DNA-binding CsgD family transcriptional regulator
VARTFAACVLGRYVDRPRAGSVWFSSLMEDGADPALAVFHRRARLGETAVVALSSDGKWTDFLEFHFAHRLGHGTVGLLNMVAGTLSRTWANRAPGLFSDTLLTAQAESKPGFRDPLLSLSNPARLSRAEFRVCLLLSRGLNAGAVCTELGITASTLKTHLRSIFAKTETTSLAELLFQLLSPLRIDAAQAPLLRRA